MYRTLFFVQRLLNSIIEDGENHGHFPTGFNLWRLFVRNRVALAVSAALMSMSLSAAADMKTAQSDVVAQLAESSQFKAVPLSGIKKQKKSRNLYDVLTVEDDLAPGTYRYIVRLDDAPVALYKGGVDGFAATHPATAQRHLDRSTNQLKANNRLDIKAPSVVAYREYLTQKQDTFVSAAQAKVGALNITQRTELAFNGLVVEMTQDQAIKLASIAGVAHIQREVLRQTTTDSGPRWINADHVWSGEATGVATKGEGKVVGIIDTGVNTDHPSFADVGGDGYDHTNPYGEGVYFGDCATEEWKSLCNDKLVGVVSYPDITGQYPNYDPDIPANGEDHNGHGSHTASTSAGNVLPNVPVLDAEGNATSVVFNEISGVAPHANVISYQVCYPGESDSIGFSGCFPSLTVQAIEHAIANNVDALNYSIGGGSSNPWNDADSLAFLSAREAGIHVATSAGNSGPSSSTVGSPGDAPWITTVAAYTHDRIFTEKHLQDMTGGDTAAPEALSGQAQTGSFTGPIVYAGNYANSNDPTGDPAQCLQPFPAGTFTADQIVVCDRGSIARTLKGINVRDGGAGAMVFANVQGGASTVVADPHVIPAIHIDADSGDALRAWLNDGGTGHTATITASSLGSSEEAANTAADFTSRGPGASIPDVLVPDIAAPGVAIFAAYADNQSAGFKQNPDPSDYSFLSGTSMASPHVAGALTLLADLHPSWTPAEAQSAIMMTANPNTVIQDGTTPSTFFDAGAGMLRVDQAAQAGLTLNESPEGYRAADPATGDPKTLNMASMVDSNCVGECSWTRTFTAQVDGTWNLTGESITEGLNVTVTPASFTLAKGETQEITVNADALGTTPNTWSFARVVAEADSQPTLRLPVAVKPNNGNLPSSVSFTAHRNEGSYVLSGLQSIAITDFTARVYGMKGGDTQEGELAQDSSRGNAYDDLTDGVQTFWFTVPEDAKLFVNEITKSESPDLDLRVGRDDNADGIVDETEQLASSLTFSAFERISLAAPEAGSYWVTVQNWSSASEGSVDKFELSTVILAEQDEGNLTVTGPGTVDKLTDYDITFNWNADAVAGESLYALVELGHDADHVGSLGQIAVTFNRGQDDVSLTSNIASDERIGNGDAVNYTMTIMENETDFDRDYTIKMTLPEGVEFDPETIEGEDYVLDGQTLTYTMIQPSVTSLTPSYNVSTNAEDSSCVVNDFGGNGTGYVNLEDFGITQSTLDGDTASGSFATPVSFLGQAYESINVTDDGFVYVDGEHGTTPWTNQYLPTAVTPNAVIAPMWRDLQFSLADKSGVTVATAGPTWTIVEWDDMHHYNFYNSQPEVTDNLDFEIIFNNVTGDIVFAYDNVEHNFGDNIKTTIGYENIEGTEGHSWLYIGDDAAQVNTSATIQNNLVVCYRLQNPVSTPINRSFGAVIKPNFQGGNVKVTMENMLEGASTLVSETAPVEVEGAPIVAVADYTAPQEGHEFTLDGSASYDPNGDAITHAWRQIGGPVVDFSISDDGSMVTFTAPSVEMDHLITFELTVTESKSSSTEAIAVTIKEGSPVISMSGATNVNENSSTTIDFTGSTDPNGDALSYDFEQLSGKATSLSWTDGMLKVSAPEVSEDTSISVKVTATDGVNSTEHTFDVSIKNMPDSSGSGSLFWLAGLLPLAALRRRKAA
jgi:subtilisin family serine protease